jgi:Collagenase and related proteases
MINLMIMPNKASEIDKLIENASALLLGIKDMSVNCLEIDFLELENISNTMHKRNKKVFVSLNKNIHNPDLKLLEIILKKCKELKIDGILYYDVAILNLNHKLSLDLPLVWSAEHLVTNYHTINYWAKFGASYAFLANEITKEEIFEITENTNIPLIVQGFGYLPMYISRRHAISNYLNYFKLSSNTESYYLYKEDKKYPILERKFGTEIYSNFILNAIEESLEYKENKIEYILLSGFQIEEGKFERVIELFTTVTENNKESYKEEIDSMFSNTSQGFLYKETIYQVKKNEK